MPVQARKVGRFIVLHIFHLGAGSWVSGQCLAALSVGKRPGNPLYRELKPDIQEAYELTSVRKVT